MKLAIDQDNALKQAVVEYPLLKAENKIHKKDGNKYGPWIISVTLIAALCVSYYHWERHTNQELKWTQIMETEYVFPAANTAKISPLEQLSTTQKAIDLFDLKDFSSSEELFNSVKTENDTTHWYLANLYFINQEFYKSRFHLNKLKASEKTNKLKSLIDKIIN